MPEAIYISNTAGTPTTVTGSDVAIISGNIKSNQYNYARVTARIEIATTGTSATTNNTLKIKLGSSTLATYNFRTDAVVRTHTVVLDYIGDLSIGGALTVTVAGAGVDANTTLTAKSLYVISVQ